MKRSLKPLPRMDDCNLAGTDVYYLNQRLHYLIQVVQQLAVARDLDAIMAAVRTGARHLTNADGATFVLRDGDKCHYADEDAISPLWKGGRFPMSACISGWVMLNQQSVIIEDIYADPRIPADAYRPTFVKSLAMVPIRTRDPLGSIGNYWATHHTPTAEEMNLLQTLADAAAVAMENVYLYEAQEKRIQERTVQLQRSLDFESLLKRITDKVRDSLDEHQILATAVKELAQGLALTRCNTTLYNLEQTTIGSEYTLSYLTENSCTEDGFAEEGFTEDDGGVTAIAELPELYHQLLGGEPCQFCSVSHFQTQSALDAERLVLACPIVDDQRVLGDIRLYRPLLEPFSELEVRLVKQVANQCAIALRQARLHETTQAQVRELELLNQLKDDFLSTVSHELRSPMTTIRMAVQRLEDVLGVVNLDLQAEPNTDGLLSQLNVSKAIGYLQILRKECQREINLINDLLDLTRLEAETAPGIVQEVVLQTWVPQVVEPFKERTQQQQQQLQIEISTQLTPFTTNPAVLERILTELLQNACKYTPPGETITISVQPDKTDNAVSGVPYLSPAVLLTVSNSGVEISESDRAHIFEKFYRIPNGDPWKHGGTGLGLALVKRLVAQLSGSIEVLSGAEIVCFAVKLPVL